MAGTSTAMFWAGIMAGPPYRDRDAGSGPAGHWQVNADSGAAEMGNLSRTHHQNRSPGSHRRDRPVRHSHRTGCGSRLAGSFPVPGRVCVRADPSPPVLAASMPTIPWTFSREYREYRDGPDTDLAAGV